MCHTLAVFAAMSMLVIFELSPSHWMQIDSLAAKATTNPVPLATSDVLGAPVGATAVPEVVTLMVAKFPVMAVIHTQLAPAELAELVPATHAGDAVNATVLYRACPFPRNTFVAGSPG